MRTVNGVEIVLLYCIKLKSTARTDPTDRHMRDIVTPRNRRQRLAMSDPRQGFNLLMLGELRLAAELHSPGLCANPPLSCSTKDEKSLEFCQPPAP